MGKGRIKGLWLILLGMLLVVIDQIIKVAVKMEMIPGVPVPVLGRWFQLVFVENAGMAFGMGSNGGVWVKLALTLFRIGLFIFLVIDCLRFNNIDCNRDGSAGCCGECAVIFSNFRLHIKFHIWNGHIFFIIIPCLGIGSCDNFIPCQIRYVFKVHCE